MLLPHSIADPLFLNNKEPAGKPSRLLTKEVSRRTNHHPFNVDNYIRTFEQVRALYGEGKTKQKICFFTRRSETLIEAYL